MKDTSGKRCPFLIARILDRIIVIFYIRNMNDSIEIKTEDDRSLSPIDNSTSQRITSLRYLLMILVVFIHNCYTNESIQLIINNGGTPPIFVENSFGQWVKFFISQGISRGAVPLFFMFAAFLQEKKNDSYFVLLKKKAKSLLLPFIIWMCIYTFYHTGIRIILIKFAPNLLSRPDVNPLDWNIMEWLCKFFSYKTDRYTSFAIQFWFIRDLIILIVISPIFKLLIRKAPFSFFLFVLAVYMTKIKVLFVDNQALLFYTVGLYWGYFDIPLFEKIDKIKWIELLPCFILSVILKYCTEEYVSHVFHCFLLVVDCMILIKLSSVLIQNVKLYKICSYLAGYSFFLFAIHNPVLNKQISKLWIKILPMKNTFFSLCQYFIPTFLTIIIGTVFGILLKKLFPKLFRLLTGGR